MTIGERQIRNSAMDSGSEDNDESQIRWQDRKCKLCIDEITKYRMQLLLHVLRFSSKARNTSMSEQGMQLLSHVSRLSSKARNTSMRGQDCHPKQETPLRVDKVVIQSKKHLYAWTRLSSKARNTSTRGQDCHPKQETPLRVDKIVIQSKKHLYAWTRLPSKARNTSTRGQDCHPKQETPLRVDKIVIQSKKHLYAWTRLSSKARNTSTRRQDCHPKQETPLRVDKIVIQSKKHLYAWTRLLSKARNTSTRGQGNHWFIGSPTICHLHVARPPFIVSGKWKKEMLATIKIHTLGLWKHNIFENKNSRHIYSKFNFHHKFSVVPLSDNDFCASLFTIVLNDFVLLRL